MNLAEQLLSEIEALPVDEIRDRLAKTNPSAQVLRAVAQKLGILATARLTKEALSHQISSSIANRRGYRELRQPDRPD
jgi:hypothetical protein